MVGKKVGDDHVAHARGSGMGARENAAMWGGNGGMGGCRPGRPKVGDDRGV
uniref:Uncharacterized protein n=1 Tax=Oryza sativa subsp. japonica TaxID=39947 RepID=Q6YPF9_ORYSJ|nr:hypothetical protein [Oryza sativa Japonica Group]BAD10811.1 hypothetical protein [Oryza sativa Japonica Group]